jgi:sulfofructose kinase
VLDAARSAGRPALLDADVAADGVLDDLIPRATHVLFSEAGLDAWSRGAPGEALRRAQRTTHALVGATLGSAGFIWLDGGRERRVAVPPVEVVDTLAAGDVWHGAFALAIAERKRFDEAAAFANAAAAIKCQRRGGRLGAPTRDEVDAMLARLRRQ